MSLQRGICPFSLQAHWSFEFAAEARPRWPGLAAKLPLTSSAPGTGATLVKTERLYVFCFVLSFFLFLLSCRFDEHFGLLSAKEVSLIFSLVLYLSTEHVFDVPGTTSIEIRVVSAKDGKCAGVVHMAEGAQEGWQKLEPGAGSTEVVMGALFVRIGEKLSLLPDPVIEESLNLEEAFPEFDSLVSIQMEPAPSDDMTLGRVFSLSVSLCDVFRVRKFLIAGNSVKTPVIIGRGINGTPLEALCANTPSTVARKKMRIEFEGKSFSRQRSADDAVAIAQLLLLAGAKHDSKSIRWLYSNASSSQGKQLLMRVRRDSFKSLLQIRSMQN